MGTSFRRREAAVVDLLGAAGRVEPDHFDEHGIEKIGDRRIVERQVSVLADPRTHDVGRLGSEPILVVEARLERPPGLFARNEPQLIVPQAHQAEEVFLKIPPE